MNNETYDLQGRRTSHISRLTPHVRIVNGKKIIK
jgi:hypothetical protein